MDNDIWKKDKMKNLNFLYRNDPPDAKCYYQQEDTCFFHAPHQQNLFLRHYAPEYEELLSVLLICRTLALPGDWHRRVKPDFLNITYIHSGETLVRIGEHSFVAEAGDIILLPPGSDHEFGNRQKSVRSAIIVQGNLVESILLNLHGQYVFPGQPDDIVQKVERFFKDEEFSEHQLAVWSFDLLSSLKNRSSALQIPETLQKVILKMKTHLDLPLSLESLAGENGVSVRTLSRLFQKYFHTPPYQYLLKLRMKRACQMLTWGEFSIKEVAISVGYPNALNFSTEFRRIFGCSPSQYRVQKNRSSFPGDFEPLPERPPIRKNDVVV